MVQVQPAQRDNLDAADALTARSALVLYGSETGNAQDVAEEIGRLAERLRFHTRVVELNAIGLVSESHGQHNFTTAYRC